MPYRLQFNFALCIKRHRLHLPEQGLDLLVVLKNLLEPVLADLPDFSSWPNFVKPDQISDVVGVDRDELRRMSGHQNLPVGTGRQCTKKLKKKKKKKRGEKKKKIFYPTQKKNT